MPFQLESVIPWGRRFDEYKAMFHLTENELHGRVLGCGDGPASFNAEATAAGSTVVSIDPIYNFPIEEIRSRIDTVFDGVIKQVSANESDFTWGRGVDDLSDLADRRRTAMDMFLADFEDGLEANRYRVGELPTLPFEDDSFDLALCSHFLFLYGEQLSTQFHVASLVELCRVATEVRVFPLLENGSAPSRHLSEVRDQLDRRGIDTKSMTVDYEFQRAGNQMLVAAAGQHKPPTHSGRLTRHPVQKTSRPDQVGLGRS